MADSLQTQGLQHARFLSLSISWSLLKLMSTELVMLSNHLVLCHPLLLLPSIFPSIRVFSNESALHVTERHMLFTDFMWANLILYVYDFMRLWRVFVFTNITPFYFCF